jgi:A/G-specific adenine glycosylase
LWELSARVTPRQRVREFNQAMMDLGAGVCTRSRPGCERCPLSAECLAHHEGRQAEFPGRKARQTLPVRAVQMLLLADRDGGVLLRRRPPSGIWGGLLSLPEIPVGQDAAAWCEGELGLRVQTQAIWPVLRHTFSHFHLDITPVLARLENPASRVMDDSAWLWYNSALFAAPAAGGLPAPVSRLLTQWSEQQSGARPI